MFPPTPPDAELGSRLPILETPSECGRPLRRRRRNQEPANATTPLPQPCFHNLQLVLRVCSSLLLDHALDNERLHGGMIHVDLELEMSNLGIQLCNPILGGLKRCRR